MAFKLSTLLYSKNCLILQSRILAKNKTGKFEKSTSYSEDWVF
ncbi:hypothetical protein L289_1585 [Acinetobacter gerneri DSM 14967 = CIP 107464 = MTCC 9824]|nr:hypothetical protein L289_1585 [Acinetobacter gerneri DSM 14967 = CIP 107464 = MTCC 9824]